MIFLSWIFRSWLSICIIHPAFPSYLIFVSALSHFTDNFSTFQVKIHNKISYLSSVHREKNRKGLNCSSKCQCQLTPLPPTSFGTAPGYEKPLTCCSISALLRERANSAEPGCMSGNKCTRTMPVRLPIVSLLQWKKALGIAHLLSTPSKSISSKEYSSTFFSWLTVLIDLEFSSLLLSCKYMSNNAPSQLPSPGDQNVHL